jgi:hypothetical protein
MEVRKKTEGQLPSSEKPVHNIQTNSFLYILSAYFPYIHCEINALPELVRVYFRAPGNRVLFEELMVEN